MIGIINKVSFGEDNDNSLARFDDLSGERLIEFGMGLGSIDKKSADIGLFDGGKGTESGEFLNTNLALTRFTESSGVEDFESTTMEFNFDAVDIAGGTLSRTDKGLLLLAERVKETGFANIRATNESELER